MQSQIVGRCCDAASSWQCMPLVYRLDKLQEYIGAGAPANFMADEYGNDDLGKMRVAQGILIKRVTQTYIDLSGISRMTAC